MDEPLEYALLPFARSFLFIHFTPAPELYQDRLNSYPLIMCADRDALLSSLKAWNVPLDE